MNAPDSGQEPQRHPRETDWKARYYSAVAELDSLERQAEDDRQSFLRTVSRLTHLAAGHNGVGAALDPLLDLVQEHATAQQIERAVQAAAAALIASSDANVQPPETDLVLALSTLANALYPLLDSVAAANISARVRDFKDLTELPGILKHAAGALGRRERPGHVENSVAMLVRTELNRLLSLLPVPSVQQKDHNRLLHLVEAGADSADLTQLFEQVARHVAATLASIHQERADVQALLREVSTRLTEFGAHLAAADNSSSEGECARDQMSEDINAELHEIVRAFEGPENIGTLQIQVQRHLEQLRFHIQRFDDVENSRRTRDRSEREHLKNCIAELEKETTQLRQELAAAKRNAEHDSLSDLPNRRGYEATLMREVARSQRVRSPLSLVALDADHFKRINDTFGHPVGDEVLRTLARIIRKSVRRNDYPARVGGEEFFVLLPDTALPEAVIIAEKLRRRIEKTHFHMKGTPVEVTISAGIGQFDPAQGVDALHQVVDAALYAAKQAGRNCCHPAADSALVD